MDVNWSELYEAERCTLTTFEDLSSFRTVYTAEHPDDHQRPTTKVEPNLLIAALMDYARETDLTFSREYLEVHMRQYNVEVIDNRHTQTVRVRVWDKHSLPPSKVNPAPPPTPTVKVTSTRLRSELPHGPVTSVDTTRCIRCGEVWPCPEGQFLALGGGAENG